MASKRKREISPREAKRVKRSSVLEEEGAREGVEALVSPALAEEEGKNSVSNAARSPEEINSDKNGDSANMRKLCREHYRRSCRILERASEHSKFSVLFRLFP
jgi:hypothetical protein